LRIDFINDVLVVGHGGTCVLVMFSQNMTPSAAGVQP
jgi:hypothetical protein